MAFETLKGRPTLFKTGKNTIWLLVDLVVKKLIGLLVGVQVARYLGAEQWGIYSYGFVFISFFVVVGSWGVDQLLIRDFAKKEEPEEVIIGSALFIKTIGAIVTSLLAIVIAYLQAQWSLQTLVITILAIVYCFNTFIVFDDWFQSRVQSKYPVIARSIAAIIIAIAKLVAIYVNASLLVFVFLGVFELAIGWMLLIPFYFMQRDTKIAWRVQAAYTKHLLINGFPMMLNAFVGMIGARVDQLLLGLMIVNKYASGQYAIAVMVSEVAIVLSGALANSAFPSIVQAKKESLSSYRYRMQLVTTTVIWLGIITTTALSVFAPFIINFFFGEKYLLAGNIMRIYALSNLPIFWGSVWNNYILAENKQSRILFVSIFNAVLNTVGNIIVIPRYGALGAAYVNVFSMSVAIFSGIFTYNTAYLKELIAGALIGKGVITGHEGKEPLFQDLLRKAKFLK